MSNPKRNLTIIPAKDIAKLAKRGEAILEQNYRKVAMLYDKILRFPRKDVASDNLLELVYKMVKAFGMGRPNVRLLESPDFKKLIKKHADTIQSIGKLKLEKVKDTDVAFKETADELFDNLRLNQAQTRLVTFSKTMHFLLPDLFMPIDRKFTLQFYYADLPFKNKRAMQNVIDSREKQKACLSFISEDFRRYAREHCEVLSGQVKPTSRWNRNIPKVIDNIIIAYVSENLSTDW